MVLCSCHRGRETLSPSGARASAGRCPMQVALFKDATVDRHRSAKHDILICRPAPLRAGARESTPPGSPSGWSPATTGQIHMWSVGLSPKAVMAAPADDSCESPPSRRWQPRARREGQRQPSPSEGASAPHRARVMIALHAAVDAGARPITSSSRPPTVLPCRLWRPLGENRR